MKLTDILSSFNTVKAQLTEFVTEQSDVNEVLREELRDGEKDVKEAQQALKQIKKIVG